MLIQYDYIYGALIPTIALVETPELVDTKVVDTKRQPDDSTPIPPSNDGEKDTVAEISALQDRPAGIAKFTAQVASIIGTHLIYYAFIYCLFLMDLVFDD